MKETMGRNNGIQQPSGAGRKLISNYQVNVPHGPKMELFFLPPSSLKVITQITAKKKSIKYLEYVTFKSFHSLFLRDIPLFLSKRKKRPRKSQSRSRVTCRGSPGCQWAGVCHSLCLGYTTFCKAPTCHINYSAVLCLRKITPLFRTCGSEDVF